MRIPKYITNPIAKNLAKYPLYSQDGKKGDAVALVKFFAPVGDYVAYVMEAEKNGEDDYTFYGIVRMNGCFEFGYFTLAEIKSVTLPYGLKIERDLYFLPTKIKDIDEHGIADFVRQFYE